MNIVIEHVLANELILMLSKQTNTFRSLNDEERLMRLSKKWSENAEFCICRDDNEELVGMIAFYANQPEFGIAYITHVYVSKEYRGMGVFAEMLNNVTQYVKTKKFKVIKLEVRKDNIIAIKAYKKQEFFTNQDEEGGESLYMQKKI